MAIDFGTGNDGSRYSVIADGAGGLNLPDNDWAIALWVRLSNGLRGFAGASDFQYFLSCGALGGIGSLHLFFGNTSNFRQFVYRIRGASLAELNVTAVTGIGDATTGIDTTDRLIVIQRRSNNIEIYWVAKGAAVSAPNSSTAWGARGALTPATDWTLGHRADLAASRAYQNVLSEVAFILDGSLSATDVEDLAVGVPITDVYAGAEAHLKFLAFADPEPDAVDDHDADMVGSGIVTATHPFEYGGATIDGTVESIALSTFPAKVSSDRAIAGQPEALTLSTFGAAIATDRAFSAALEQISLTTFAADLSLTLNAVAEQITLGTFLAAVALDQTITGSLESILLQTSPASISTGSAISGQTEQLVLQTQPAQVALDIAISAQLQQIVLTSLSAQIGLAQNIDANLESLVLTAHGATLTLDGGITAQLEALTLSTFTASITSALPEFDSPGLQYTIAGDRAHYTLPVSRLHFTFRS